MSELITSVSVQSLTELLQEAGYRVNQSEQNGIVQLLSASQGIGFAVRFGNPAAEQGSYVDFTYSCALRVQGELPEGLAQVWNASRRFARLSVQGEFLLMEMDVVVAGVGATHLRSQLELWDRLLQEFIVYLREYSQHAAQLQAASGWGRGACPVKKPTLMVGAGALALLVVAVALSLRPGQRPGGGATTGAGDQPGVDRAGGGAPGQPADRPAGTEKRTRQPAGRIPRAIARQPWRPGNLDPLAPGAKSRARTGRRPGLAPAPGGGATDPRRHRADRVSRLHAVGQPSAGRLPQRCRIATGLRQRQGAMGDAAVVPGEPDFPRGE